VNQASSFITELCNVTSLVIKDLVYEAKVKAKSFFSRPRSRPRPSRGVLEDLRGAGLVCQKASMNDSRLKAWPRGQQD